MKKLMVTWIAFARPAGGSTKGIKNKLLYFPDGNHWVLKPQNALVWQREFYKWLKEML